MYVCTYICLYIYTHAYSDVAEDVGLYAWLRIQQNLIAVCVFMAIELLVFPVFSSALLRCVYIPAYVMSSKVCAYLCC
jgi:hypothetical protein